MDLVQLQTPICPRSLGFWRAGTQLSDGLSRCHGRKEERKGMDGCVHQVCTQTLSAWAPGSRLTHQDSIFACHVSDKCEMTRQSEAGSVGVQQRRLRQNLPVGRWHVGVRQCPPHRGMCPPLRGSGARHTHTHTHSLTHANEHQLGKGGGSSHAAGTAVNLPLLASNGELNMPIISVQKFDRQDFRLRQWGCSFSTMLFHFSFPNFFLALPLFRAAIAL